MLADIAGDAFPEEVGRDTGRDVGSDGRVPLVMFGEGEELESAVLVGFARLVSLLVVVVGGTEGSFLAEVAVSVAELGEVD